MFVSAILDVMSNKSKPDDYLLFLIQQAKCNYQVIVPKRKERGRPRTYSARSFFLLSVVAVVLRTFSASELHHLLGSDEKLRMALDFEKVPHRKTIARRLKTILPESEDQIRLFGKKILLSFAINQAEVSAIDGRMYESIGAKWHKRDRIKGVIPTKLRNVDTESHWFKSGYRGFIQGYRLVLQSLVFPVPVPLYATWQANNVGEATILKNALTENRLIVTDVLLADETLGAEPATKLYEEKGGWLLSPKRLSNKRRTWKHDLYEYRKETIELLFQRIIQASDLKKCKVKGLGKNGGFVLASVWLYQLIFWINYKQNKRLTIIKELLDLARWRVPF